MSHQNISKNEIENNTKCNPEAIKKAFVNIINKSVWVVSDLDKDKLPLNPKNGQNAKINDPQTWGSFEQVETFINGNPTRQLFPAVAISEDLGITVLDLDKIRQPTTGNLLQEAQNIVNSMVSYTEMSVSGTGLHIFIKGKKPGKKCRHGNIEIYDRDKFMTLTGNIVEDRSDITEAQEILNNLYYDLFKEDAIAGNSRKIKSPSMSDEEVLTLCRKAKNADKFASLYDKGDTSAYGNDDSAADLALCYMLAFYTQDPEQINRIFRNSKLYRPKWEREDYRKRTIRKVITESKETFQASKQQAKTIECSWENPANIEEEESLNTEFPTALLSSVLKKAVEEICRAYWVDPALATLPGLGIAALMIGKKAVIVEKPGLRHNASLFLAGVAASGERKSSCFDAILSGIKDEIDKEIENYTKEKAAVRAHNELIKEQVSDLKRQLKDQKIDKQTAQECIKELYASEKPFPQEPYNFGDDITSPRLFQKLYEHAGVYGVFSSDARSIFKKILGTKDGESGEALYLGGMWGDDISRSRVGSNSGHLGGEDMLIRKPALTTVAFIQPDLWADLSKDIRMRESGLVSRISLVIPNSQMGSRLEKETDIPLDHAIVKVFTESIMRLRNWKPKKPIEIQLSSDAAEARREFYNAIEIELRADGKFEDVKEIATKATSIAARFSLVLAMLDAAEDINFNGQIPPISKEQWLRAQIIEEYFLAQAIDSQRTHSKTGSAHILQKVVAWLKKQATQYKDHEKPILLLASQISKGVRGTKTSDIEEKIIPILIEHKLMLQFDIARGGKPRYEVNPRIIHVKD